MLPNGQIIWNRWGIVCGRSVDVTGGCLLVCSSLTYAIWTQYKTKNKTNITQTIPYKIFELVNRYCKKIVIKPPSLIDKTLLIYLEPLFGSTLTLLRGLCQWVSLHYRTDTILPAKPRKCLPKEALITDIFQKSITYAFSNILFMCIAYTFHCWFLDYDAVSA